MTLEEIRAERARLEAQRAQMTTGQAMRDASGADGRLSLNDVQAELYQLRQQRQQIATQQQAPSRVTERPQRPPGYSEFSGAVTNFGQGLTLGGYDELTGAIGGVGDAVGAAVQGRNIPEAFRTGFDRESQRTRSFQDTFLAERPNVGNALQGTGAAAPILLTSGAVAPGAVAAQGAARVAPGSVGILQTAPRGLVPSAIANAPRGAFATEASGRGAGAFLAQTARAGSAGAAYGGTAGFLSEDGDLAERAQAGNESAGAGGVLGAAAPALVNTARGIYGATRPARSAITRLAERIPTGDPAAAGMFGGNIFTGRSRPPMRNVTPRSEIPRSAAGTLDRLADRARMSADDVESAFTRARENPQGQVVSDVFGDPGVRTTRAIAQGPGQTGQLAADTARQRFSEAPDRIIENLNRRLGVGQTPQQAIQSLEREYAEASAELYQPLFARPTTPQQTALFEQRIGPLLNDPVLQDAMRRGEEIFARESRLGAVQGEVTENLPRYLHYIKMGLDDAIGAARRNPTGIQSTEMRGVMELRRRFVTAVDEIVPGYQEARARWGGLREAEDALEQGAGFLRMRGDEISAAMADMSPFAQHHARIGLAAELETRLGLRGSVNGNRNVAEALGSPEMQRRVAAAFENPQQAADFLDVLNTQNRLMRNAGQWNTGSQTYSNALHGADEGLNLAADMAGSAARGDLVSAASRAAQGGWNALRGGALERANNERGGVLLRRIDSAEAKAFADEIVRILREREAARAAASTASRVGGAAAGAQQGQQR